ncbi:MAG: cyclic nucleotide-binding domain-containing protein, partial [Spirochaetia bacterium]|nr:cyclic nucleotide-binding domain-containing protein [Spirochaetia bacterium]
MFATHSISCQECSTFHKGNFHSVPEKGLHKLDSCKQIYKYKKGELIFQNGETSQHFYCVSSGEIQLFRTGNQKEHSFAIVGPGAWLGHRDVIAGTPFQHNARCLSSECKVCRIDKSVIKDFINKYPSFMSVVMKELAQGWI